MKKTISNWKQLGEVLSDPKMNDKIIGITINEDKLESITFESKKEEISINDLFENAEMKLAEYIDTHLYLPVKNELQGKGITHSLGMRKENLKGKIFEIFKEIQKEIKL